MLPSWNWNIKPTLLHPANVKSPDTHCPFCLFSWSCSISCSESLCFLVANAMLSPKATTEPIKSCCNKHHCKKSNFVGFCYVTHYNQNV